MKDYYTYAYLREDRTPYYIGKGKGRRIHKPHLRKIPPKDRRVYLKRNLTEEEAFRHEVYMISILPNLHNLTEGGEGGSGYKWTEEQKNKLKGKSTWNKGQITSTKPHAEYMREYRERKKEGTFMDGRTTRTNYERASPSTHPDAIRAREYRKRKKNETN